MGKRKWPWVLGGTVTLCGGLVLVALFVTGFASYDLPPKSRELDKVMAESKRLGLPMTQEELKGPAPAAGKNAAPNVTGATQRLGRPSRSADFFKPTEDPAVRTEQDAWFRTHDADLDAIKTALAQMPQWYVDRDYDMSIALLFPELSQYKFACKMLALRGAMRAKSHDVSGALDDFESQRVFSTRIESEPFLIGTLVSLSLEMIALRSLENYVDAWRDDKAALGALKEAVEKSNIPKDPTQALRGEFYFQLSVCRNYRLFGGMRALQGGDDAEPFTAPSPSKLKRTGLPEGMFERASMTVMADLWNKAFRSLDGKEVKRGWSQPFDQLEADRSQRFRASEMLPEILCPVYSQADQSLTRSDVNQRLAVVFVGAFRFHAEKGRWPKDLSELALPSEDPYDPPNLFRFKFSDKEVRVWSIGKNRVDDRGEFRDPTHQSVDDIVFVWPTGLRKQQQE